MGRNKNLIKKLQWSINGIKLALQDFSFKIMFLSALIVVPVVFFSPLEGLDKLSIIVGIFLLLVTEGLNTMIERFSDLLKKEKDVLVGEIKDIGSGVSFIALICNVIIWAYVVIQVLL